MKNYDLEERTMEFSKNLIILCKNLPKNPITIPLLNQVIRSGTSIGANYCEANGGSSKKDFRNKIFICKKESKETKYWLELLATVIDDSKAVKELNGEVSEFILIFSKIAANTY